MLTSINPLGQRGRGHRWGPAASLLITGSVVGGLTTGLVLGALGSLLSPPLWVGAAACLVALLLDLVGRVPTGRRQVDEDWLTRYRMWVYSSGFGWQLGTGVVTIVTSAATYAWLALLVVAGLPWAVVGGAVFGLVRALPMLLVRTVDTPDALRDLARRVEGGRTVAHWTTVGVLGLAAGALL